MKSKFSVVLLGLAIFLLGGVAGAVSHYIYREHVKPVSGGYGLKIPDIVGYMARELSLDDQQKEQLRVIFTEGRKRMQALNQEFRPLYENVNTQYWPRWEKIRDETDDQVRKTLRPDQKARFEAFLKKVHSAVPPKTPPPSP